MITFNQYFGGWLEHPDATEERKENAETLLLAVAKLQNYAELDGVVFPANGSTSSQISGSTYGGFRPQSCCQGSAKSAHKEGQAVDLYDPHGYIDEWCMANLDKLEECGIYLESPMSTYGWSHWGTRRPCSGKRVFYP